MKLNVRALMLAGTAVGGTVTLLAPGVIKAQNAVAASQDTTLEEVVVTAEKKSESAERAPVALSAFGGSRDYRH